MKAFFEVIALVACILAALYFDLVICGVAYPEKIEICSAYSWPLVGTAAKAKALEINNQLTTAKRP